jgi:hypothetical protein
VRDISLAVIAVGVIVIAILLAGGSGSLARPASITVFAPVDAHACTLETGTRGSMYVPPGARGLCP